VRIYANYNLTLNSPATWCQQLANNHYGQNKFKLINNVVKNSNTQRLALIYY